MKHLAYLHKGSLLFLLFGSLTFFSCKKLDERSQFVLSYISAAGIPAPIDHVSDTTFEHVIPFNIDFEGDLAFKGTKSKKIESAEFFELYVWLDEGSEARNFNHMDEIVFFLRSAGREDIEIRTTEVKSDIGSLRFNFSIKNDIKQILEGEQFELVLKYESRETLLKYLHIQAYLSFFIDSRRLFI